MGFLKNLKVCKVSFVRRGANKRKFLLLKSEDSIHDNDQTKGGNEMKELVKEKVIEILNKEQDPAKVVTLLKADKDIENLKLSDEEFTEVANSVEFFKSLLTTKASDDEEKKEEAKKKEEAAAAIKKAAELSAANGGTDAKTLADVLTKFETVTTALEKSQKTIEAQSAKIEKQEAVSERRDVLKWLHLSCPYLPADFEKTADEIIAVQKESSSAAATMKEVLKSTSAAMANSDIFEEAGSGGSGRPMGRMPGSELIGEVKKALEEVKKSGDDKIDAAQIVRGIVNGKGRNFYLGYREEVLRRAKLSGLGAEAAAYL